MSKRKKKSRRPKELVPTKEAEKIQALNPLRSRADTWEWFEIFENQDNQKLQTATS